MEKFWMWLAWKLPRPLVKWCAVRLMAAATNANHDSTPSQISILDALQAWKD